MQTHAHKTGAFAPGTLATGTFATGTFAAGTFEPWERPNPVREIQTSIPRALKTQYESPKFLPEPLARLLAQLARGEGEA
jgi:hypothetical protein